MGFTSSALPRSVAAGGATAHEPSGEQPQPQQPKDQDDDEAAGELTNTEGMAGSAWPDPVRSLAEPFGLETTRVRAGAVAAKWRGVEADIQADSQILTLCDEGSPCPPAAQRFLAIVAQGRAQHGRARVGFINRAINLAIKPMSDLAQWGVIDRWSAPLETFTARRGDCEDYAIAKYVALTAAGVAAEDLKLVVVRDTAAGENHMIVAVRLDGAWLTLDNRWLALVRDSEMRRTIPLFVLDESGARRFAPTATIAAKLRASAPASF
jgi:predicted transglutaminase-like cysteine proteinase